jgi:iron complex transport system substrate-binding protein
MQVSFKRILVTLAGLSIPVIMVSDGCQRSAKQIDKCADHENFQIEVRYARGFSIEDHIQYKLIHIYNPWENITGKSITYLLYPKESALPLSVKYDVAIPVPVRRVICTSTTHIAMIGALEEKETITGISGKQYINDPFIRSGIERGEIPDIGYEQSINFEMILTIKPDVIFMYGVTGEVTAIISRLASLGIPVVLNAEYLENNPLARTEWIKFMSCFYDKLDKGIDFFGQQEKAYLQLKNSIANVPYRPSVLAGLPWKNTWWVPGGKSHTAVLINDAGGRYIWENDSSEEALPLDIEAVYNHARQADIWINTGSAESLADLVNTDPRLQLFKPFRDSSIYNNNARLNPSGGNDYWESGVIYPYIILKDLISIFHPEILPEQILVYYKRLK